MKYFTILGFLFVALSSSLSAQTISFEKGSDDIDLGLVSRRSFMSHTFKFKNEGDAPLLITKLESPSEFVLASAPSKPVGPGETATIELMYDATNMGLFNDALTIVSNAKNGRVTLRIKGEVR